MALKWLKRLVVAAAVTALAVFGGYRIRDAYQKKAAPKVGRPGAPGVRVVTVGVDKAKTGTVREELLVTGALKPKEQIDVNAKATGRLEKIHFHVGDRVKLGDLIAELEDAELQQQVKRAAASQAVSQAALVQRRAELSNGKAELSRTEELFKEGLISRRDLDARQTGYQVVQAQVELARSQVLQAEAESSELQIRLEQSKIHAPMSGHVARRYVDVGALVNPSTPLVHLVNLSTMVTMANVPERQVSKLRVGNQATVEVDAFGPHKFTGRIVRISPVLDAATRSALVEMEIPNSEGGLKAEMFARVTLDLATTRKAVLIPREALVYRGTQPGVYVLQSNRPAFRGIDTGLTQGDDIEVVANLEAGVQIVSRGASMLTEGDQIRVAGQGGPGGPGGKPGGRRGGPGGPAPGGAEAAGGGDGTGTEKGAGESGWRGGPPGDPGGPGSKAGGERRGERKAEAGGRKGSL